MYDDIGLLVAFGLGDGSAGENRDFANGGSGEHMLEHTGADEACCAGEDEMHFDVSCLISRWNGEILKR